MPQFTTEVTHQLGRQQATERLKQFIDNVRRQYQDQVSEIHGEWNDSTMNFSLTTYGFTIDGALVVEDDRAVLSGTLPLAAIPFRGKIEQTIGAELQRELA
jgi:hypothetical protein